MKVNVERRPIKVLLTKNIFSLDWNGKRSLLFSKGDIITGYLKKPLDGVHVDVNGLTYNIMLDEFEIIKSKDL